MRLQLCLSAPDHITHHCRTVNQNCTGTVTSTLLLVFHGSAGSHPILRLAIKTYFPKQKLFCWVVVITLVGSMFNSYRVPTRTTKSMWASPSSTFCGFCSRRMIQLRVHHILCWRIKPRQRFYKPIRFLCHSEIFTGKDDLVIVVFVANTASGIRTWLVRRSGNECPNAQQHNIMSSQNHGQYLYLAY